MAFKSTGEKASGETTFQGSEVWNASEGISKMLILKILIEINLYEVMAKFGKQDLEQELDMRTITQNRIDGFDRLIFAERQIIQNCMFQIDREDRDRTQRLVDRLNLVEGVANGIVSEMINDVTKETELRINEPHFRKCLDVLSNIKEELHFILNKSGLIFRKSDETNLDDFMKSVYE
jgi:DNA-directed RNA polymerase subunit F